MQVKNNFPARASVIRINPVKHRLSELMTSLLRGLRNHHPHQA